MFGIRIGVDPSWFIVLFLVIWSFSDAYDGVVSGGDNKAFVLATAAALLFFTSVVLHELGHAFVARRNGMHIAGIDLWLFGGVAKLKSDAPSPGVEFRVAAAGPLVTFVLAGGCALAAIAIAGGDGLGDAIQLKSGSEVSGTMAVLGTLVWVNTGVLVFNLIPGFPLDGGRIVRAIAWWRTGDRIKATHFAARLGRGFAYALMAFGAYLLVMGAVVGGVWLAFIGWFLSQAARSEEMHTTIASRLEGLRVSDVMDAEPVVVQARMSLEQAQEEFFLRYGWPWFPVVDHPGHPLGVLTQGKVDQVPEAIRHEYTVQEVMIADPSGNFRTQVDAPLETLLGTAGLTQLGAVMAVDADGVLRGIVTADQVRRALQPTPA